MLFLKPDVKKNIENSFFHCCFVSLATHKRLDSSQI